MKCPSCDHVSETALLKCGECGETFDRLTLEKYQSVEYLISWLNKQESVVGTAAVSTLQKIALHDRNQIHQHLFPEPAIIELDQPLANTLALLLKTRTLVPQWLEAKVIGMDDAVQINGSLENRAKYIHPKALEAEFNLPDVSIEAARRFAYKSLKVWTQQLYITSTYCELLREHLEGKLGILAVPKAPVPAVAAPVREGSVPESVPQPQNVLHTSAKPIHAVLTPAVPAAQPSRRPRPASSPPRRPPKPPKPPRPKQPPIRWDAIWKKVVDAAVSGLLVRWLRYLGAFLFVMSLAIVVVSFWENIPPLGQVAIIFFIPTLFYGGGLFVRRKLGIEQTGGVLMGVGQLLLAVDFAAIYQFGGLTMDLNVYWLITSIICSLVYLFTVLRLVQDEFFGYIGLAGVSSTAMALVAILAKSPEWPIATLAAFALPSVEIGYRLSKLDKKWAEISRAAFRFTYVVIPVALGLILFVPSPSAPLAQALAFGLATSAYGLLAFRSPNFIHTHLAVWGSMLTVGLTLRAANLEWAWWSLVGTLLAPMYIIFERTIFGRKPKTTSANITHQMAFYLAGFGLLILSIAAGMATTFFDFWPGVFALTAASAVLAVLALPNRHSFYFLSAVGLYLLPFTLTVLRLLMGVPQRFSLLTAAWVGVALLYLAGTALFREKKRYSRWPALLGILIVPVSLAALILFSWIEPWGTSIPALLTIGGAIGFYTFAAVLQYRGKIPALSLWLKLIPKQIRAVLFLTIVGVLLPVWIAVAWLGSVFAPIWLGAVFSGLAILYIGGGQVLYRVRRAYRFPIHVLAYLIGFAAVLFALPDRFSLMSTLYINVVGLVVLAIIYRRAPEASLAAVLFLWPFQLTISIAQIMPHAHSLAYLVLSGVAYIPLGIMMRRKKLGIKFTLPIFIIGYLVSIYGLLVAMLGQYPDFLVSVEWIPVIVPLLATVLYVYSVPLLDRLFSWAAAGAG